MGTNNTADYRSFTRIPLDLGKLLPGGPAVCPGAILYRHHQLVAERSSQFPFSRASSNPSQLPQPCMGPKLTAPFVPTLAHPAD